MGAMTWWTSTSPTLVGPKKLTKLLTHNTQANTDIRTKETERTRTPNKERNTRTEHDVIIRQPDPRGGPSNKGPLSTTQPEVTADIFCRTACDKYKSRK